MTMTYKNIAEQNHTIQQWVGLHKKGYMYIKFEQLDG